MRGFSASVLGAACLLAATAGPALASPGNQYWWMDEPGAFGGSSGGSSSQGYQPQQQVQRLPQQSYAPQQQNNFVAESGSGHIQTQCPAGTKCVADYFCDANAVMVGYRVSLTPAQKKARGDLIPCMNSQGNFDVCCSTSAAPAQQQQQQPVRQNNFQGQQQFQQQQQRPVQQNIPTGSCPNIGALPPVENCGGMTSNCWSVNQPDTDCPGNALCCFDGCRNACYFGGNNNAAPAPSQSAPRPPPAPRPPAPRPAPPQPRAQPQQNPPQPRPQPQQNPPQNFQGSAPQSNFQGGQEQIGYPQGPVEVDPPAIPTPAPRRPAPAPAPVPAPSNGCPNVSPLGGGQCAGERDTCWNTGRRDDCSRGFLCCNDGCSKTCYNEATGEFLRHPQSQLGNGNNNNNNNVPNDQYDEGNSNQVVRQPVPAPAPRPRPVGIQPRPAPAQQFRQPQPAKPWPQQQSQPVRRRPQPANDPWPQQQQVVQQPPRRQTQQQSYQPQPQQQFSSQNNRPVVPASEKPFITCPSAMKCVRRSNCDFKGVMTDRSINYTPELEMLSVPTIPCVSPTDQSIDVCCRDPNYKDPWPGGMMNNGGNQGFGGNQGGGNNFQGQQTFHAGGSGSNNSPRRSSGGYGKK